MIAKIIASIIVIILIVLITISLVNTPEFNGREEKTVKCYDELSNEIKGLECKQEAIEGFSDFAIIFFWTIWGFAVLLILTTIWTT